MCAPHQSYGIVKINLPRNVVTYTLYVCSTSELRHCKDQPTQECSNIHTVCVLYVVKINLPRNVVTYTLYVCSTSELRHCKAQPTQECSNKHHVCVLLCFKDLPTQERSDIHPVCVLYVRVMTAKVKLCHQVFWNVISLWIDI